jgi:hypothetical protein
MGFHRPIGLRGGLWALSDPLARYLAFPGETEGDVILYDTNGLQIVNKVSCDARAQGNGAP